MNDIKTVWHYYSENSGEYVVAVKWSKSFNARQIRRKLKHYIANSTGTQTDIILGITHISYKEKADAAATYLALHV